MALRILSRMILGDNPSAKLIGALLLMVKIAVIVLVLYLIATVSLIHLIWTAGGMLAGLVLALVVIQAGRRKKAAAVSRVDGKESNEG